MILDEYWVFSLLVKYSISQMPADLLALATATAVAMALLLGSATPAGAATESTGVMETVANLAAESPADEQPSPSTAETEPVNTTEAPPSTGNGGAGSPGESSQETAVPQSNPTPAPSNVAPIDLDASERRGPVATTASRVSRLAGGLRQDAAEAVEPVTDSAGSSGAPVADSVKSIEHVTGSVHHSLQGVEKTLTETGAAVTAQVSRALSPIRAAENLVVPARSENLRAASAPIDAGHLPYQQTGGSPDSLLNTPYPDSLLNTPRERVDVLGGLVLPHFPGLDDIEVFQLRASASNSGDAVAGGVPSPVAAADTAGASSGGGWGAESSAPLSGNHPLPHQGSSQAAASGLGGSSFVPIVALLALLALAVPAIFRRLREMPDFAAPIPYVCALERPG